MTQAEAEYLKANGWVNKEGTDSWSSENLGRYDLRQGHAVNSQKEFDRWAARGKFGWQKRTPHVESELDEL